jgi:hypothetical protein
MFAEAKLAAKISGRFCIKPEQQERCYKSTKNHQQPAESKPPGHSHLDG